MLPYDRFIYYRPLGESLTRADSKTYFGHGVLSVPFPDPYRPDHRFVDLSWERFASLVPLKDPQGIYFETGTLQPPPFQSAVRTLSEISYHRILAGAGVSFTGVSALLRPEDVVELPYPEKIIAYPKDELRIADSIPQGAGYVPHGDKAPDLYESASLQERARADHQNALRTIAALVHAGGGKCWYNNNIDLFAQIGAQRLLIEAKSINGKGQAVDRMRYGIGQLTDYGVRYGSETQGALKVLAFARPPEQNDSWIANILEHSSIAFLAAADDHLLPLNDLARELHIG